MSEIGLTASRIPKVPRRAAGASGGSMRRATAQYLRDTGSGVIASRMAPVTSHAEDVRRSWTRVTGLAMDLIKNSGRLKGAADQVLADTVGVGLSLAPDPDLDRLGYDAAERGAWIDLVKKRWRGFWLDKRECDMRGKLSGPEMVDIALRWYLAYGEVTGVFDFFGPDRRARYNVTTGTKLRLYPPNRLVQDTSPMQGLFQGVQHDDNGRAVSYRFKPSQSGVVRPMEFPAFDPQGRPVVLHIFEAQDSEDVRGISPLAAALRKHIQSEKLDDATLQMATLQTIFALTLTSGDPSQASFEAMEALRDFEGGDGYASGYLEFLGNQFKRAFDDRIAVGGDPTVSHLAPGEKLGFETANLPGQEYLPFASALARDMARAIGCTYGALTMDHSNATYSSVRMENASIWPVVLRRRARVAAPLCQAVYGNWLDEEVAEGRLPFKGGYRAFAANRARISRANWLGPSKPSADDHKSARAVRERLEAGVSSIEAEIAELGGDPQAVFDQRLQERERYASEGLPVPYERDTRAAPVLVENVE